MQDRAASQLYDPYQADGGKAYHEAIHGGLGQYGYSLISKRRAAKMQPFILSTDSVFEYGVGPGWNLANIKAGSLRGLDVATAVRPIVEAQGIEFVEKLTTEDLCVYDVVICSHVLEHLLNPTEALAVILACLKPNGKALLYVPFDFQRKYRKYNVAEPNHHLYTWNVQSFSNLLLLNGFAILEGRLQRFGYERIVAKWVEKLKLPDWTYTFLIRAALLLRPAYELAFVVAKSDESFLENNEIDNSVS